MRRVFETLRISTPECAYSAKMDEASAAGWDVVTCGYDAHSGFWAILSKPALLEGPKSKSTLSALRMQICQALAEQDMNVSKAAAELGVRRQTLQDHIKRIHAATGLNPLSFYDLNELLYMEVDEDEHGIGKDPGAGD